MKAETLIVWNSVALAITVFIFLLVRTASVVRFDTSNKLDMFMKSIFFIRDRRNIRNSKILFYQKSERTNMVFYAMIAVEIAIAFVLASATVH